MDGTKTRIINPDGIELNGNSKTFVTYAALNTALQGLGRCDKCGPGDERKRVLESRGTLSLDISAAETTTVKTGG